MENKTREPIANAVTMAEYQRTYRSDNPEKVIRWRITQAANLLRKHGYQVIAPAAPEGGVSL